MKRKLTKLLFTAFVAVCSFNYAEAQINVNINIGSQPVWGPVGHQRVDYYYLPDIESYYDVPTRQFIYLNNGRWVYTNTLPPRYGNYDLFSGYKVIVNRPKPYLNFDRDRAQYASYRGWKGHQENFRDHGGNTHGIPPGQAKKMNRENGDDNGKHNNGHDNVEKHDHEHDD